MVSIQGPRTNAASTVSTAPIQNNPAQKGAGLEVPLGPIASQGLSAAPRMKVDGVASAEANRRSLPGYRPTTGQIASVGQGAFGSTSRGFTEASILPRADGWDVTVDVHHTSAGDDISLFVSARITDIDKGAESWVVLGMPVAEKLPGADGTDAFGLKVDKRTFFVSLDDINDFLVKMKGRKADGTPVLTFEPGSPLSIDAKWQQIGHEAGGRRDQRNGYLITPPLLARSNVISIRGASAPIIKPEAIRSGDAASKPIDLVLLVPSELQTKYPLVFAPGATMVSRREEEAKFEPRTFQELKDFTLKLINLSAASPAKQQVELEGAFGEKGWKLKKTDRYYKRDASGRYETYGPGEKVWKVRDTKGESTFDFAGLPKVAGMYDQYTDSVRGPEPARYSTAWYSWNNSADLPVSKCNGAVRFRDGEIKNGQVSATMGKLNVKPGGGVVNPYNLTTTRLEYALDTNPGMSADPAAMAQLNEFLSTEQAPFNPMAELRKVAGYVDGSVIDRNMLDNQAERYKFTLEHQSGLELEISCDFIELRSKDPSIEPGSTKGFSQAQKFDHWEKEFLRTGQSFSGAPGAVNRGTFQEYTDGGKNLVEVDVEATVQADGRKTVKEQLIVHAMQVETEMDHVQARATGAAQAVVPKASRYFQEPATVKAQEDFFKNTLSDNLTFGGPPTIHNVEDLKEPALYSAPSYEQMSGAVVRLESWGFPNGILGTRQKAALGLEKMGAIPPAKGPKVEATWTNPIPASGTNIQAGGGSDLYVGGGFSLGQPAELVLRVDGYPITLQFKGTESAVEIRDRIFAEMDKFKVLKPVLASDNPNHIILEKRG